MENPKARRGRGGRKERGKKIVLVVRCDNFAQTALPNV